MDCTSQSTKSRETLASKSIDEIRVIAKSLGAIGLSSLRKAQLIDLLVGKYPDEVRRKLFPTWWERHHNHAYGVASVAGLLVTLVLTLWPMANSDSKTERSVPTIESPISFAEYAAMWPADRSSLFTEHSGDMVTWEGYLLRTIGFEMQTLRGVPFEQELSIEITPVRLAGSQMLATISFGELLPTDSGCELAARLDLLRIGQRLRLAGTLSGSPDKPELKDTFLEASFPIEQ